MFQQFNLFPHLNAIDNLTLASRRIRKVPRAQAEKRALELLARVGLEEKARAVPAPALRRPAAAGRDRAGADDRPARDALRRGHLRARPGARRRGARGDARPRAGRDDDARRHARDAVRPRGRRSRGVHGRRPDRRSRASRPTSSTGRGRSARAGSWPDRSSSPTRSTSWHSTEEERNETARHGRGSRRDRRCGARDLGSRRAGGLRHSGRPVGRGRRPGCRRCRRRCGSAGGGSSASSATRRRSATSTSRERTPGSTSRSRSWFSRYAFGRDNRVTFECAPTPAREPLLTTGRVDLVISTFTYTTDRDTRIDFSRAYYKATGRLLVKNDGPVQRLSDISGRRVATTQRLDLRPLGAPLFHEYAAHRHRLLHERAARLQPGAGGRADVGRHRARRDRDRRPQLEADERRVPRRSRTGSGSGRGTRR